MDMSAMGQKLAELIKKYKYVILVVLLGIGLMLIPSRSEKTDTPPVVSTETAKSDTAQELAHILTQIKGAGKVQVYLSCSAGEKTIYQMDTDSSTAADSSSVRSETVIITDGNRAQQTIVQQILPPTYQGAIVVCQGADDPSVRLAIVDAVSDVTGIGADRISVMKMK